MEVTHNAREAWLARAQMDKDVWTHPALCWNGSQFAVNGDVPEGSDLVRLSPAYLKRECPIAADPLQLISKLAASQRIRELPLDFEPPREGDAVLKQLDGSIFAPRLNVNARMIATSDTPRAVMHYICRSQRLDGGKCYAILTGIDYFDHRSGGAVVGGTTKQGIFLRTFRALKAGEPAYHDYFAAAHVNCVQTAVQYGFVDLEDENIAIPNSVTICLPNPLRGACLPCTLWRTLQDRALRARVTFSGEQMSVKGSPTDLKRNGISPTFAQLIKLLFPTPLEQLMFLLHTHKGLRDLWDKQRKICQPTLLEAGSDNPRLRSAIARCFVVAEDCIASLARLVQHTITSNNLPHHPVRALSRAKPTPVTLFAELAASASFVHKEWGQTPVLYRTQQGIADIFTMDDLAVATDNNLLPLAQFFGRREGGDQLASSGVWRAAGADRGTGFYGFANVSLVQTKYLRFDEVEEALLKGSIVYNCAGATHPKLGSLCLTAMDSFDLPVQANLYVTGKGIATSATPHSDKQNVLVLQSRGAKHWRVFAPPPPFAKPAADPLARGKLDDTLRTDELGEPLIDVVLKPGDCLYVPAGFPHTTDTVHVTGAGAAAAEASVHITLGVATNLWGLSYADARSGALSRTGQPDTLTPTALQPALYWLLMRAPSSLGFFRQHQREHERACAGLVRASRLAETARWENMSDAEVSSRLDAPQIIAQLERHRERIVSIHRKMHLGAVRHQRVAPSDPGLSIARVETYKKELEAAHQEHLQWFKSQPEAATAGQEAEAAEAGDQQAEPPPYRRSGSSSPSRRSSGKSVRWWDERD